ncbi:MAG: uroporphyrinogen decarboxylase family protein [Oscillospiraceae bacterium]
MLTKRQNLLETIRGGKPDRYVNQYEPFAMVYGTPYTAKNPMPQKGGDPVVNAWGVTIAFPDGMPGPFPVHDKEHIVCKDITHWRDYVKAPNVIFSEEEWAPFVKAAEEIDRSEYFVTPFVAPGIFEQCHYLLEIQNCLTSFYMYPDEMHELIDYITDWEIRYAEQLCKYIKPDALFHHDDWGSQASSFMSPEMFKEFYEPAYKKVYGYYKDHGVEVVVHHSDSYAANLVPSMIDIGIDIWQGVMSTNNIPELLEKYYGKITFMGGIDSGKIDRPDWTRENIAAYAAKACAECGTKFFIPCNTMGGPESIFLGVYDTLTEEIAKLNEKYFPAHR